MFETFKTMINSYKEDLLPSGCMQQCNELTSLKVTNNVSEAYTHRNFCKKACTMDEEEGDFDDCLAMCKEMCWKDPISDNPSLTILDRSPGDPESSKRCFTVCSSGCKFRENERKAQEEEKNARANK